MYIELVLYTGGNLNKLGDSITFEEKILNHEDVV